MIVMRKRYEAQLQKEKKNDNLACDVLWWVCPSWILICNSWKNLENSAVSAQQRGLDCSLETQRELIQT